VAALARAYQDLIERLFREGIKAAEFRADLDSKLATLALLGLCNSVITNRGAPPSAAMIDAMIEEYARIVSDGVVAGGGAARRRKS